MEVDCANSLYTFDLNECKWTTPDDCDDDNGINESTGTLFIILPANGVINPQYTADDQQEPTPVIWWNIDDDCA